MPVSESTRRTAKAVAKMQARDIERVVGRSGVLSSRIWRASVAAATSCKEWGANGMPRVPLFKESYIKPIEEELIDIMAYSYLLRWNLDTRRRTASKSVSLKLASPVHEAAQQIATRFDLSLGNVRKRFEPIAKKATKRVVADIRDTMNRALAQATRDQMPVGAATDFVLDALESHGLTPRSNQYVETLVRTHGAIAYGAAHRQTYENDFDLWGFEYVTVGDNRVRPEHEALEGVRRKKDDPFWNKFWPPNGWNCRCQAVAIYEDDVKQTPVPDDVEPDEGFDTDFTDLVTE